MEKVKITKEQAEAIERGIKIYGKDRVMNDHEPDGVWVGNLVKLNGLTKSEIAKSLYIGYEIEPEFNVEVGDWIKDTSTGALVEIINQQHRNNIMDERYTTKRHATPEEIEQEKERRFWANHGRKPWELKMGDTLINKNDRYSCDVKFVEGSDPTGTLLVNGRKDEFIELIEDLKKEYIVFCFEKDRLDLSN